MFPVYVYQEGVELPKEGTYFVVAGNGQWLHKDTGIVRRFVPVDRISVLKDLDTNFEVGYLAAKIPSKIVWKVKQFFVRILDKYNSEAEVNLYYNKETKEFRVHVPEQTVHRTGVKYKRSAMSLVDDESKFLRIGTIHSHCNFSAFHSGVDIEDEEDFDGLHVTFGNNDRDVFSIVAAVVVNGHRTVIDPTSVMEGIVHKDMINYSLIDSDYDPEFHQWSDGLDEWVAQVKTFDHYRSYQTTNIVSGCKVAWLEDMKLHQLKESLGEGPFEVIDVADGKIAVKTNNGFSRISSKLFKRI